MGMRDLAGPDTGSGSDPGARGGIRWGGSPLQQGPATGWPRPVWLLDVDGVLNASKPGWGGPPLTRTAYADAMGFRIRFAPALLTRLWDLHRSGAVEVRWATTWVDHIDQIIQLLQLPPWQCAFSLAGAGPAADADAAKYAAALQVLQAERRPLIWTDDEAIPAENSHACRWLRQTGPPVLLIRPRSHHGLEPDHLDRIETFLKGL